MADTRAEAASKAARVISLLFLPPLPASLPRHKNTGFSEARVHNYEQKAVNYSLRTITMAGGFGLRDRPSPALGDCLCLRLAWQSERFRGGPVWHAWCIGEARRDL